MISVIFCRKFCAAHRLKDDTSVCKQIHGHNYICTIYIEVIGKSSMFIIPADTVKLIVDKKYDHKIILENGDPIIEKLPPNWVEVVNEAPSTENLAGIISEEILEAALAYGGYTNIKVRVHLQETETIMADVVIEHQATNA
jgi:6-pyruvoyl-tetrahydropterin synthase